MGNCSYLGGCYRLGRKRLDEGMVRVKIPSRLPKWMVDKLTDMGGLTENLEKAVILYLKENNDTIGKK